MEVASREVVRNSLINCRTLLLINVNHAKKKNHSNNPFNGNLIHVNLIPLTIIQSVHSANTKQSLIHFATTTSLWLWLACLTVYNRQLHFHFGGPIYTICEQGKSKQTTKSPSHNCNTHTHSSWSYHYWMEMIWYPYMMCVCNCLVHQYQYVRTSIGSHHNAIIINY